jgi:protein involved in polysaccharide export with SLBB domain
VKLGLASAPTVGPGLRNALTIDLTRLYQGREAPELRIPLRGGDTIMVPPAGEVYVDGWVTTPGGVPLSRGMTLTQAVANAGGLHFAASRGPFTLQRSTADGDVKRYIVDYKRILSGAEPDPFLQPGDRIQVSVSTVKVVPWALFNMVTLGAGAGGGVSANVGKK